MADLLFSGNFSALVEFQEKLKGYQPQSDEDKARVDLINQALDAVGFNRAEYDEKARISSARSGRLFLDALKKPLNEEEVQRILYFLTQFIREVTLQKPERTSSEQAVLDYFIGQPEWSKGLFDGFSVDIIRHVLPFDILEEAQQRAGVAREEIASLKEKAESEVALAADNAKSKLEELANDHEVSLRRLKDSFFHEVHELEGRIQGYKDSIRNLASAYNFAGLSHAFENLIANKAREKWLSAAAVLALGICLVALPAFSLRLGGSYLSDALAGGWSPLAVTHLIAWAAIEIFVLYFFRVALKTFLLTRTQITNLQLRLSICSFIEGYRDFVRDSQSKGASRGFEKFEDLIFSQLPSGDGKLPATIDGIEHISSIIQTLKKPA